MRRLLVMIAVVFATVAATLTAPSSSNQPSNDVAIAAPISADLPMFATQEAAQKHCPKDTVVWLNTNSGIYHLKGERWYGRTRHGAYVCKKEADAAGDRETENGQ